MSEHTHIILIIDDEKITRMSGYDVCKRIRSDRPYRAGWTAEKTREYIIEGSGSHFDPRVVEAFIRLLDEFPDLR